MHANLAPYVARHTMSHQSVPRDAVVDVPLSCKEYPEATAGDPRSAEACSDMWEEEER
jgi:hypothetical protein